MCEYPITGKTAGDEASSTYEGRHLTIVESELVHPYHAADGYVDKGDPVIVGDPTLGSCAVGVAFKSAAAATDKIAIDTEGIWYLYVLGKESDGTINGHAHALSLGDPVYIQKVPSTDVYLLSGQDDPSDFIPFGYVLGDVASSLTEPTLVAVKVHWSPNYLESINVGSLSLNTQTQAQVVDNLEIDIATFRTGGETQESWGLEYAWMKCFVGLKNPLHINEDMCGIYMRLEDDTATTGGDLFAGRFQTHANNSAGVWTRLYGLYVAISNEHSAAITEQIGIAIAMGGGASGTAPSSYQTAIQIMGDTPHAADGKEAWFQTEIGRGCGLEAETSALGTKTHQIPILINGTRYCIPVVPWV
jgi:hypothetical protein